jgi:alkanesulfonate monooxygenase SsuD/methylene tetrahydromethanopterin reductase-like flavin-dependent oxidoreductase (luciferase family)
VLLNCTIGETEEEALEKLPASSRGQLERVRRESLFGTPEMIRERLAEYAAAGVHEVIIWLPDAANLAPVRLFAQECLI